MSDYGKKIRLNRILRGKNRKALIVAYDHAQSLGPIPGMEDPAPQVKRLAEAHVDAVLLTFGSLKYCADSLLTGNAPGLIVRLDWINIWREGWEKPQGRLLGQVEDALRLGADAVITYLLLGTGDDDFEALEMRKNAEVARECERLGVPHLIESLARGKQVPNPNDPEWVRLHTRIASELGADLIKTDYTGDPASMRSVVETCPTPILVLGGPKQASDEAALEVIRAIAQCGAAGIVFGRNIFQAENMGEFISRARALLA